MTQLLPGKEKNATASRSGWMSKDDYNLLHGIPAITSIASPLTLTAGVLGLGWPKLRLNYIAPATADLSNGAAIAANTWTTVGAAQSFTVNSLTALLVAHVSGLVIGPNVANVEISSRLSFDGGAATVMLGGEYSAAGANPYANFLAGAGPVYFNAFAAGAHTVAVQIYSTALGVYFCRPQTQPNSEALRITVLELTP